MADDSHGDDENALLQQKHAAMLNRLAAKEDSRLQKSAARKAESAVSGNPDESTDLFLNGFSESCKDLEEKLASVQKMKNSSEEEKACLKADLDQMSLKISELEKYVADKSYFLPAYEVRASQTTISVLREKLAVANAELVPKKKFSFRNKAKKTEESDKLKLSDKSACRNLDSDTKTLNEEKLNDKNLDSCSVSMFLIAGLPQPCKIHDLHSSTVMKSLESLEEAEVMLENLTDCKVYLKGTCRALYVHKLKDCHIYAGPVTGSCLIEDVENCVLMLASHQIRVHHTKQTDMYLRVRSRPIVEYTTSVRVAPYAFTYDGIENDLLTANLHEETGLWQNVDDFRWLRAVPSPNWSVLPVNERMSLVDASSVVSKES